MPFPGHTPEGPAIGPSPFAKAVLAVDADYRSLRKDAFPLSRFSEKSYLRACLIIFTISFSKYKSYKSSLNHLGNRKQLRILIPLPINQLLLFMSVSMHNSKAK